MRHLLILAVVWMGCQGERGEQGEQGLRGHEGRRGVPGKQGEQGRQGPPGESVNTDAIEAKVDSLADLVETLISESTRPPTVQGTIDGLAGVGFFISNSEDDGLWVLVVPHDGEGEIVEGWDATVFVNLRLFVAAEPFSEKKKSTEHTV